jgi:branched-chain amino acid transport system substrate-binding protein
MRKALVSVVVAIVATVTLGAVTGPAGAASSSTTVHIGALLSLTGGGSSLGNTTKAALTIAVQRWNAQPAKARGNTKLALVVVNTDLNPDQALSGLEQLAAKGVKVVIGPQSSSEVAKIKDRAAQLGVLIVSQGSTASSLAIPDDNVFRFVPTDHVEGKAITDLMMQDGAQQIVPMWRNDAGNQGLSDTVRSTGPTQGTTVTAGVRYEPGTTDFTTALDTLTTQVNDAVATVGNDHVVVYLAGFEETAEILAAAKGIPALAAVSWYGGDGSAQAKQLVDDKDSAAFAIHVHGYPSPLVALPASRTAKDAALIKAISKKAKAPADAFTLAAYDALNVSAKALVAAGADPEATPLSAAFTQVADGYPGVTGTIELDAAGDRTTAPYAFWSICATGSAKTPKWVRTGLWEPPASATATAKLTTVGCPAT